MTQDLAFLQQVYRVISEFIVTYSFQILGAIIILLIGFRVARWVGGLVLRLGEQKQFDVTLTHFLAGFARILILVFVCIIALGKFGISIAPFIAALGAIAFGGSLAIQGPLSNYGAGIVIILTRPFVVGDTINIQGVSGVVDEVSLTATILSTEDGERITIPNKKIVGEILVNSFGNRIVESTVGISYSDDPQKAIAVIKQILHNDDEVVSNPAPQVGIDEFADSAITIALRYWVPTRRFHESRFRINLAVHQALAEAAINIPFPQRDVHLISAKVNETSS